MRRKRRLFVWILPVLIIVCIIRYGNPQYEEWKESHSGIPDVVSCMSSNNFHHLTVVANSSRIDDKEAFAREVVEMCRQNSFHSIRFSTDIKGYPSGLDITVYLNRKNLEKREPVCEIEFRTERYIEDCDIKNDVDKFHLYLDGREIDFYE